MSEDLRARLAEAEQHLAMLTEEYQAALAANEQLASALVPGELVADFWVPAAYVSPKERPRIGKGRAYTPSRTSDAEQVVGWLFRREAKQVDLDAEFAVAISVYGSRADGDNLLKMVLDALQGICYKNDRQVRRAQFEMSSGKKRMRVLVYRMQSEHKADTI